MWSAYAGPDSLSIADKYCVLWTQVIQLPLALDAVLVVVPVVPRCLTLWRTQLAARHHPRLSAAADQDQEQSNDHDEPDGPEDGLLAHANTGTCSPSTSSIWPLIR